MIMSSGASAASTSSWRNPAFTFRVPSAITCPMVTSPYPMRHCAVLCTWHPLARMEEPHLPFQVILCESASSCEPDRNSTNFPCHSRRPSHHSFFNSWVTLKRYIEDGQLEPV